MTKEIAAKSFAVFGNILAIAVFTIVLLYFLYGILHPHISGMSKNSGPMLYLFLVLLPVGICSYILQLIYFPTGVIMDDELKQLTVKYLFKPQTVINIKEIASYKEITIRRSRGGDRYGVLIYLTNKKQVLFSDLSLDDYFPVEQFLYSSNVESADNESFSFMLYYFSQW